MDLACRLAAEQRARIVALNVLEVPLDRALGERFPELEDDRRTRELDEAVAIGDSYGVRVLTRLERAHSAGPAIVAEADARNAEIIVLGSPRRNLTARQAARVREDRRLRPQARAVPRARRRGEGRREARTRVAVVVFSAALRRDRRRACSSGPRPRAAASSATCSAALFIALGVARFTLERKRRAV